MTAAGCAAAALAACLCAALTSPAPAQVVHLARRQASSLGLSLNTITVSATPSTITFALQPGGVASGSQPASVTTSWLLGVASTVKLYGFFLSSAALSNSASPGDTIGVANVFGQCPTGSATSFTAFTQSVPLGGAASGLLLFKQAAVVSVLVNRTDQLNLHIDLTAQPQLPAGTYTGTLTLQAQAF